MNQDPIELKSDLLVPLYVRKMGDFEEFKDPKKLHRLRDRSL